MLTLQLANDIINYEDISLNNHLLSALTPGTMLSTCQASKCDCRGLQHVVTPTIACHYMHENGLVDNLLVSAILLAVAPPSTVVQCSCCPMPRCEPIGIEHIRITPVHATVRQSNCMNSLARHNSNAHVLHAALNIAQPSTICAD